MGYESRFYIVEKSSLPIDEGIGMRYAEVIAVYNMCKVPQISDVVRRYPKTDVYIYDGENERIIDDRYGRPLTEIPIPNLITIIEDVMETERGMGQNIYRRYLPFLNMLKSFDVNEWSDLVVLHYGY